MEEGNRERSRVGELEHVTIVGMIMINGEMKKLNEMDWGMARSSNNHTIRSMICEFQQMAVLVS